MTIYLQDSLPDRLIHVVSLFHVWKWQDISNFPRDSKCNWVMSLGGPTLGSHAESLCLGNPRTMNLTRGFQYYSPDILDPGNQGLARCPHHSASPGASEQTIPTNRKCSHYCILRRGFIKSTLKDQFFIYACWCVLGAKKTTLVLGGEKLSEMWTDRVIEHVGWIWWDSRSLASWVGVHSLQKYSLCP